jgi:hypothetical protein
VHVTILATMNKPEFDELWRGEKSIIDDIHFSLSKGFTDVWSFDDVEIHGTSYEGLFVNASFACDTGSVVYNFIIKGLGGVHRYCLGGTVHGDAGRYHQHILSDENDVRRQLPNVVPRNDLRGLSTLQSWRLVCQEANITHTGEFFEAEGLCK